MERLARAYLYCFGLIHIVSYFFHARVANFPYTDVTSFILLVMVLGLGTISVAKYNIPPLTWVWALLFVIGWCLEFTETVQWVDPWRHDQYILLTCMNAVAATLLIYLAISPKDKRYGLGLGKS